jgi:hypothetical protein
MAFVYVLRPFSFDRMTILAELSLDGRRFGSLSGKTFLCAAVKPGPHELKAVAFFGDAPERFEAEVGRNYFFQVSPKAERWTLESLAESEARKKIARYRLSGDNAFEAGGPVAE